MLKQRSRPITNIDEGLDMISTGLLILEQSDLEKIGGKRGIDITARMNAQYNQLKKILDPRKEEIKDDNVESVPTTYVRGSIYKAVIRRYYKDFPDFIKIKKLLGKKWDNVQERRRVTEVSFDIQG